MHGRSRFLLVLAIASVHCYGGGDFSWRSQGLLADDDFPDLADEIDESFYDQPSLRAYEYWYRQSFYPTPRTAHRRAEPPAPSAALPHRQQPPTTHRQATTAPAHSSSSRRVTYRPSPSTLPLSTRKIPGEPSSAAQQTCWIKPPPPSCNKDSSYRTIDGSCNNLRYRNWGRSEQPLVRLLRPDYDAGQVRSKSVQGGDLPSPRKISTTIHKLASNKDLDHHLTSMHMLWGQFIDHDISHTPFVPKVKCCDKPEHQRSADCIPITVPRDDPYWGSRGISCMELRRSMALRPGQCSTIHEREQLNNLTSFIDGSLVYGSTDDRANLLRSHIRGQLAVSDDNLLPTAPHRQKCDIPVHGHPDKRCFNAGDKRSNVWAGLTGLHLVFVRLHNKIAAVFYNKLKSRQPYWSAKELDEKVYQETRRVVGALLQVVTYGEYLPTVLGKAKMEEYRLEIGRHGVYNSNTNPGSTNVFATAAFRFGHSQIPFGTQPKSGNFENSTVFVSFTDTFNQPAAFRKIGFSNIMRGVCMEPALSTGPNFSPEIRDKLFMRSFAGLGLDLAAVNVQRGRDHGIPSYNEWRNLCGLERIVSFHNMADHTLELGRRFSQVYRHPDDIDLYTGGITETPVAPDSQVGPSFACLLGTQFHRLKEGDRFWFENQGTYRNPFTTDQVAQLRRVKLSKLLCEVTQSDVVPESVFKLHSRVVHCDSLPYLNLYSWL